MDFTAVQRQLNDLPATFRRPGVPYTQFVDSLTSELNRDTNALDGLVSQVTAFTQAQFGWLDIWGQLFGVPRLQSEADALYSQRISYTVLAGAGPPVAIAAWIQAVWHISVTVTESFPTIGYTVTFPSTVTSAQILQIVASLSRIRPAGVPIRAVNANSFGTFLNSIDFFNAPRVEGSYLLGTTPASGFGLGAATNNSIPTLPGLMLTDPILNP